MITACPKGCWPECDIKIEEEHALKMLHEVRDKIYEDLLKKGVIDGSIPKEHYYPIDLWKIAEGGGN